MRTGLYALLLLVVAVFSASVYAQTVDTAIVGTVTDTSGALIPGANVTATSVSTGIAKSAVTAASGEYTINYLLPGSYDVAVTANGFSTTRQQAIEVQLSQEARVNIQLHVGATTQQVIVQGAPPLLQTQTSSLSAVVTQQETENLPLNGRKFNDLAILTPGTTSYSPDNHTESEDGASVQSYSEQLEWGQTNVDGVTMMGNRHAYVNMYPSPDAIQEFDVVEGDAEAEYVGSAGDITNVELKSGTNAFHGDAFDYLRNTALDARNYFIPAPTPKPVYRQNQFGATIGGPIVKNHTFFFASYEGNRSNEQSAGLSVVLTPAELNGDFSALLPQTQLVNPYTGAAYVNNQIPVDPTAQAIVKKYMPLPNTNQGGFNYAYFSGGQEKVNQFLVRLDDSMNARNQLALHFMYAKRTSLISEGNPNFNDNESLPIYNAGLQYVHTMSPTMVNELRLGIDFESDKLFTTYANTGFTAASVGINGFVQPNGQPWPPSEEGFPVIGSNDLLGIGSGFGIGLDQGKTFQIVDNVTWTHGTHTLLFGGDVRAVTDNADTSNTPYGVITFDGSETAYNGPAVCPAGNPNCGNGSEGGFDGADLMLGVPANVITPEGDPLTEARQWRMFYYVQHNWKATHNLTVNTGVNYSYWAPPRDNLNTSESMDWYTNPITLVPLDNFSPIWHVTGKDFGPRLGFAYSLPHQMVVRAGYGISFYGGQFDNINILQLNPPDDPSFSVFNGNCGYCGAASTPSLTLANPVPTSPVNAVPPNIVSLPPGNGHPDLYIQTWNATVSKQFGNNVLDLSYVGVKGLKEDTSLLNWNVGPPLPNGSPITVQQDRPNPQFSQMRVVAFNGASIYEGFLVHFQHRLSHGLDLTVSYARSSDRDNQGGGTNQERNQTQNPFQKVWANGLTEQKNNLTVAALYNLPKLGDNANTMARHLVNGWALNAIFQYLSGSPIYIHQGADGQNNGNNFQYPDLVSGQPHGVAKRSINEWFNTAEFTEAVGHFGNTPRNPSWLFSPANEPLELELARNFVMPYAEQHRLSLQIQAFNFFNHPQFSAPSGNESSGSFGTISSTKLDNREVQLVAKYYF